MRSIIPHLRAHIGLAGVLLAEMAIPLTAALPNVDAATAAAGTDDLSIVWVRQAFDGAGPPFQTQLEGDDLLVTYENLTVVFRVSERHSLYVGTILPTGRALSRVQRVGLTECLRAAPGDLVYGLTEDGHLLIAGEMDGASIQSHRDVLLVYSGFIESMGRSFEACADVIS